MFTKQVRPLIIDQVKQLIILNDSVITADVKYSTSIKQWLSPIIDLSDFYVYPINGITEGLNYWMGRETRSIIRSNGDYEWVDQTSGSGVIRYISCPSSIDGNYTTIPTDVSVALDIAYVGTTQIKPIQITPNIEFVFYSLSKPFGLKNIRTGWMFTRKRDIKLHKLHYGANYYNYYAHSISETILKSFPVDYIHNKFWKVQHDVCKFHQISPSDSVWLATSSNDKYKKFRRNNTEIARMCITEYINEIC